MGFRCANPQKVIWCGRPHFMFSFMFSVWSGLTPELDWNDLTRYYDWIIVEDVFNDYNHLPRMRNCL